MQNLVYLSVNGQSEWTPLEQARIPVLDRGFIFGDGIYEVVPVYAGKMFRAEQHMARLERSLAALRIANPHSKSEWMAIIQKLIDNLDSVNQFVYIQITRGVAKRDHAFPKDAIPTVFAMNSPLALPTPEQIKNGVAVVSHKDERWLNCQIKSVSLLGNVLMKQFAVDNDAAETIMFRDGNLSEGSSTNIWVVKNGTLLAPVRNNLILEGIRYGFLEELAQASQIPFEMRAISQAEVMAADELMLTSATREVLPITQVDGKKIGNGHPGAVFAKLYSKYQAAKSVL